MLAIRSKCWFTLFALLTAVLPACSDSTGVDDDLSGDWVFSTDLSIPQFDVSCGFDGELTIRQTGGQTTIGGTYAGSMRCSGPGGSEEGEASGRIEGDHNGNSVSFTDDEGCVFEGTVSGKTSEMEGGVTCPDLEGADVSGTWSATLKKAD